MATAAQTPWSGAATIVLALAAAVGLAVVVTAQVDVTHEVTSTTVACGSPLDTIVDRTGWESWLAADLAEQSSAPRGKLVRTQQCPSAINGRIVMAAVVGVVLVMSTAWAWLSFRARKSETTVSSSGGQLRRIGVLVANVGLALTAAGIAALVLLLADADSTLFLYMDRLVVAIAGLIVLVPPIALFAIGRFLVLAGDRLGPTGDIGPTADPGAT